MAVKSAAIWALIASMPAFAATPPPWPLTLRSQITTLTNVGYRIGLVAAPLCPSTAAGTGIAFDYIGAYEEKDREAISALLGMSDAPQIAAVAAGSPAEAAGIKPGDDLVAIDGIAATSLLRAAKDKSLFADELEQHLAATPQGSEIKLTLQRDGHSFDARIAPRRICSSRFVIKTGIGINAFSDGTNVAVSSKLIAFSRNDDEVALIAGHEIGHVINRDDKAGSLGERRAMEDRADLLGVRLMKCAGYDPETGVNFWLRLDASDMLRLLRSPSHRSKKARVALMLQEANSAICPPSANLDPAAR